jgi:hypothetical protein
MPAGPEFWQQNQIIQIKAEHEKSSKTLSFKLVFQRVLTRNMSKNRMLDTDAEEKFTVASLLSLLVNQACLTSAYRQLGQSMV